MLWKSLSIIIILNILFLLNNSIILADENDSTLFYVQTEEGLEHFGNYLYNEGEYFRAISEYKRLLFFYPQYTSADTIQFRIGECYTKRQKWEAAHKSYQKLLIEYPISLLRAEAHYKIGESYFYNAMYDSSIEVFEEHIIEYPAEIETARTRIMIGRCYLWQYQWDSASEQFNKPFPDNYQISSKWLAEHSQIGNNLIYKSPYLAGLFSTIIPGTGQWYSGRGGDAFFSFYLIGFTAGTSYLVYKEEHYTTTYILASLSSLLYLGNIYGGIMSAKIHNREIREDHLNYIEMESKDRGWFK